MTDCRRASVRLTREYVSVYQLNAEFIENLLAVK